METRSRHVVLIGAGHAHVQVLRRWIMQPPPETRASVVVDRPVAVYSGMVPAWLAGELPRSELEIDVRPLARRAGVGVIVGRAERVDAAAHEVHVEGRGAIPYDLCSLNIGATVAGLEVPGAAAHAIPTRPIARFLDRIEAMTPLWRGRHVRLVVVGAGAGGVD